MKNYVLLIPADRPVEVVEISDNNLVIDYPHFTDLKRLCSGHVDTFERVALGCDYSLLCDESGLLKDSPVLNVVATCLAHQPIVGDAVLVVSPLNDPDFFYLSEGALLVMLRRINNLAQSDLEAVLHKFGLQ